MDFLKKAKAKQAELAAQVQGLTKGTSALNFGDKRKDEVASSAPEPAIDRSGEWKEVSSVPSHSNTSTPSTAIATPTSSVPATPATTMSAPARPEKPRAKLSLAQRKNFRDEFEAKKPEFEEQITTALGVPWTIEVDIAAVMNNKGDGTPAEYSPGNMISRYIDSAVGYLKDFAKKYEAQGLNELNTLAAHHVLVVDLDYKKPKDYTQAHKNRNRHYCRGEISDGFLFLYINPESLYSNADYAFSNFEDVILEARVNDPNLVNTIDPDTAYGLKEVWQPEAEELQQQARDILNNQNLTFDPNVEALWQKLDHLYRTDPKQNKLDWGWRHSFAGGIKGYFEAIVYHLKYNKFEGDDMLQEAFNEAVDKNIIKLVFIDKLPSAKYNQLEIKDGVLELQTTVPYWRTNESQMGDKVMDLL